MDKLNFFNFHTEFPNGLTLYNNGHSSKLQNLYTRNQIFNHIFSIVEFQIPENLAQPYINGGLLLENYETMNAHLHWGSQLSKGSEHFLNGIQWDAELHLVHKNVKYPTADIATQHSDGLAVVGLFLEMVEVGLTHIYNI